MVLFVKFFGFFSNILVSKLQQRLCAQTFFVSQDVNCPTTNGKREQQGVVPLSYVEPYKLHNVDYKMEVVIDAQGV